MRFYQESVNTINMSCNASADRFHERNPRNPHSRVAVAAAVAKGTPSKAAPRSPAFASSFFLKAEARFQKSTEQSEEKRRETRDHCYVFPRQVSKYSSTGGNST